MKRLKLIDLIVFTMIAVICDVIAIKLKLLNLNLYIAVSTPILILLYIRWGTWVLIPNVIISFVHFLSFGGAVESRLIHSASILIMGITLLIIRLKPFKKLPIKLYNTLGLYVLIYILMLLSEWGLSYTLEEPIVFINHLTYHSLNIIFGIIILILANLQPNIVVSMKSYESYLINTNQNQEDDGYEI